MADQRLLVFSAHAADFCSRCGGTIAKHIAAGDSVRVVDATFGERGESGAAWRADPTRPIEEVKAMRRREAEAAAGILGVEIAFYDWGDYPLFVDESRFHHLVEELRAFRPTIVLTHWTNDPLNQDHDVLARAALRACSCAAALGYQSARPPLKLPRVYLYEATIPLTEWEQFNPDLLVDVTATFDRKKRALAALVSQPELPEWYERLAERRAHQVRALTQDALVRYAEAFKRYFPAVEELLA